MYTIQYTDASGESRMQSFDTTSRMKLARHLAHFDKPILAVYERATVITKAMRAQLLNASPVPLSRMSRAARDFIGG